MIVSGHLRMQVFNTTAGDATAGAPGIGLRNVRERLVLHFAETATFEAGPAGTGFWLAQIEMPIGTEWVRVPDWTPGGPRMPGYPY